jgi:hypothetical protein
LFEASDSSKRFLIADEVGLGKTLIAKGVLAKVLENLKDKVRRIDIVYVCSNLSIAAQNITRLNPIPDLDFADAERITLLPLHLEQLDTNRVNFVAFTPGTSLDMGNTLGTARERMLLHTLLLRHWGLRGKAPLNLLQGNVQVTERFRERAAQLAKERISPALQKAFFETLDRQPDLRQQFASACERFARQRGYIPDEDRDIRNQVVGRLRRLLAQSCIGALEPDLIILDEFQRFKALLEPGTEEGELASELFEWSDEHAAARVLLLSATPYKAYTLQHEIAEDDHYEDFLRTVRFLDHDPAATDQFGRLLAEHRNALFRISETAQHQLYDLKSRIEGHLRRIMSRTERLSAGLAANGMLKAVVKDDLAPSASDLRTYPSMRALSDELEVDDAIDYWKSAPYPLNFMEGYQLRAVLQDRLERKADDRALVDAVEKSGPAHVPLDIIRNYQPIDPLPNARFRELTRQLSEQGAFDVLWLPPSLPYYPLSGPFEKAKGLTKRLIFSAWHLVPRSIASLLSYECERRAFTADEKEPKNTLEARKNRRGLLRFSESEGRLTGMPGFCLLYPSGELARRCDPRTFIRHRGDSAFAPQELLDWAVERVKEALPPHVRYAEPNEAADERWYWVAPILLDIHAQPETVDWWNTKDIEARWIGAGADDDGEDEGEKGWARHVCMAKSVAVAGTWPDGRAPHDLPRVLALTALAAPATCALRALGRLFDTDTAGARNAVRDGAAMIGWGFRSLYNRPETIALLRRGSRDPYWNIALEYGFQGCLASVLEEYLHVLRDARGHSLSGAERACPVLGQAAMNALQVRTATLEIDELHADRDKQSVELRKESIRSLFAMRFGSEKNEDQERVRRDSAVSAAFNSPFWPFVLVTTSVGQEGLDFHWYCHAVVHWNLPSNPVDLEQREGRVHRFKGHAVRKNVAIAHGVEVLQSSAGDVWTDLFRQARLGVPPDDRGLVPYWLYPNENGAWIERHVLLYPFSQDEIRYRVLQRSLGAYRMVFGQPRQDELLAYLLRRLDAQTLAGLSDSLRIDLAPPRRPELERPSEP